MPPRSIKNQSKSTTDQTKIKNDSSSIQPPSIQFNLNHQNLKNQNSKSKSTHQLVKPHAIDQFAQAVHLIEGFADTLDAIPPSLTRSLSDLKELDAVLSAPLKQLHSTLDQLLDSIRNPDSLSPDQRLQLLRTIVYEIENYKLGGEDKIRVANGTCESLSHHIRQLDTTTSLLISSLPPSLESRIPASTFPTGYPKLSGSLRSNPVGNVWHDSTPSNLRQQAIVTTPPSVSNREFVSFDHHESPSRSGNPNSRPFDPQPLPKRPRIGPSATSSKPHSQSNSTNQVDDHLPRRSQGEMSSKLLDQHMMLSQTALHHHRSLKGGREDNGSEPKANLMTARSGKSTLSSTGTLSRQTSQVGFLSPSTTTNGPSNSSSQLQPAHQTNLVGSKKRVRKSNPVTATGKSPAAQIPNDSVASFTTSESKSSTLSSNPLGLLSSHPIKPVVSSSHFSPAAGQGRKAVTGVRPTNDHVTTVDESKFVAPVPTKRSYTKRATGPSNGTNPSGPSKGKRKKFVGTAAAEAIPPHQAAAPKETHTTRKPEPAERGRKGTNKESVRLEDVLEGSKPKQPKKNPHPLLGQHDLNPKEKEARKQMRETDEEYLGRHQSKVNDGEPDEQHQDHWMMKRESKQQQQQPSFGTIRKPKNLKGGQQRRKEETERESEEIDNQSQDSNQSSSTRVYCFCKGEVYGDRMVGCDNSNCPIEWFHYQCAGLTEDPTGNWFCPDCQAKGFGGGGSETKPSGSPSQAAEKINERWSGGSQMVELTSTGGELKKVEPGG